MKLYCCLTLSLCFSLLLSYCNKDDDPKENGNGNGHDTDSVKCELYQYSLREQLPIADSIAKAWSVDADLIAVYGINIDTNGIANTCDTTNQDINATPSWNYNYRSFIKNKNYIITFRNRNTVLANKLFEDSERFPLEYLDSDSILVIFMQHGGRECLAENPTAQLNIYLENENDFGEKALIYAIEVISDTYYKTWEINAVTGEWLGVRKKR